MSLDLRAQLQKTLGDSYRLERELGGGGMSRVFEAEEIRLKRKVAIKVLSPELAQGLSVERFEREIQTVAGLQQANIVPVLTAGDTEGLPFYTMPFVDGESLRVHVAKGPMSITAVIGILRDVSKALAYAHRQGVVHRDIKPDNVLLSEGTAVVTDFGIAKAISAARTSSGGATLTQMGTSIGTPAYMAPEQAAGDPNIDSRADIYSLGAMAYELLSGQAVFANRTPQRMLAAHMSEAPVPIQELRGDIPLSLADLVMSCLAKEPGKRPQQAGDIVRALETITSGGSMQSMPPVLLGGPGMFRKALAIYAAAFVVVAIVAKAAIVGIGLPDWVFPGSLIVMALGLPVVLWTGYVQRVTRRALVQTPTFTPGGSPSMTHGTIATMALKAAPHVSWYKTARGGMYAFAAFIAMIAAFMGMRAFGIGPFGSLLASGGLQANQRVLVATFKTRATDSTLGVTVSEGVRMGLAQSNAISVETPAQIAAALTLMQKPVGSRLDDALARDVALRDGVKAIVVGEVAGVGTGYLVRLQLVTADSGRELFAAQKAADGARELIDAIDEITRTLRGKIGESLKRVNGTPALAHVSTTSLEALHWYTEGELAADRDGDFVKSAEALRRAVAADSTFSSAWRKLAAALDNISSARAATDSALTRAYQFRDRLPDAERKAVEAYYFYAGPGHDRGRAIKLYEASLAAGDPLASNNLAILLTSRREYAHSDSLLTAALKLRPTSTQMRVNQMWAFVAEKKYAAVDSAGDDAIAKLHTKPDSWRYFKALSVAARGEEERSLRTMDSLRTSSDPLVAAFSIATGGVIVASRGQLSAARSRVKDWRAAGTNSVGVSLAVDSITVAMFDIASGHPDQARARLDHAADGPAMREGAAMDRPYLELATTEALAGKPDRAREILRRRSAELKDTALIRQEQPSVRAVLAEIALAEKKPRDAVSEFWKSDSAPDGPATACLRCVLNGVARAWDQAGVPDSARVYFERYDAASGAHLGTGNNSVPDVDAIFLGPSLKRLGELYETKDPVKAAAYYRRFIELWKNADPELQPQVAAARARLEKLTPVEKPKR